MNNKAALLGVLQSHAPNGNAQEICADIVRSAEAEGANPRDVEKMLVYMLSDGFKYGNWPWAKTIRMT